MIVNNGAILSTSQLGISHPLKAFLSLSIALTRVSCIELIAPTGVDNDHTNVPTIFLDVQIVTDQNVDETVIADNFHSREEVYRGAANQE